MTTDESPGRVEQVGYVMPGVGVFPLLFFGAIALAVVKLKELVLRE